MPLYARLDRAAVESLARRFGINDITGFSVMDGGRENTNYRLETSSGKYVLTLCDQKSLKHATNLASLLVHSCACRGFDASKSNAPMLAFSATGNTIDIGAS